MQTSNPDYLFQSSAQLQDTDNRKRKRAAAAGVGSPLDVGKVIDLVIVGGEAYVAESGWQARRVDLNVRSSQCLMLMFYSLVERSVCIKAIKGP
jgi:hypothetical protein